MLNKSNCMQEIKDFLSNWFFQKRNKIENGLYNLSNLTQDIKDLCFFVLQKNVIELIANSEFPRSMHKKRNLVKIGGVFLGEKQKYDYKEKKKIVIQSMAISPLNNLEKLEKEFCELSDAGAEIIRVAVTGISDAKNLEELFKKLANTKYSKVPIVMCGQYNVFPIISNTNILNFISKLRINPGNISLNKKDLDNFTKTIEYLNEFNKNLCKTNPGKEKIAIRIGVNWGSLDEKLKLLVMETNACLRAKNPNSFTDVLPLDFSDEMSFSEKDSMFSLDEPRIHSVRQNSGFTNGFEGAEQKINKTIASEFKDKEVFQNENNKREENPIDLEVTALVLSVIFSGLYAELLGFEKNLIVVSCKTSETESAYLAAKFLSILCDYPIHLGITESGSGEEGVILSSTGLAPILREGIGDTIRVSLTQKPFESRTKEVIVCKQILSSLGLFSFKPKITSCPGCGRTDSSYFRILAEEAKQYIDKNLDYWCEKFQTEKIKDTKIAVMGCLVNGPGEMSHAQIGISLPGFRESGACLVYLDGKKHCVLKGENIKEQFFEIIENYFEKKFSKKILI